MWHKAELARLLAPPLHVVETRGFPWTEIDFPEDYWRACGEVLPAIINLDAGFVRPRPSAERDADDRAGGLTRHV